MTDPTLQRQGPDKARLRNHARGYPASRAGRAPKSKALLLTAAVLTLTSYGPGLGATAFAAAKTSDGSSVANITWWTMWSGSSLGPINAMVKQFNSTHRDIHVTEVNVPSSNGDAKLLSAIAVGDPPDVFTEWNPVIGADAQTGAIEPFDKYLTGQYAGLEKWMYPLSLQGGVYNGKLYAVPMGMNSWALYYNKSMMKAAGITTPPTTLAQLDADQAKEWKFSGNRLEQFGFYPYDTAGVFLTYYLSFFGAVNCFAGSKYDLANCKGAVAAANWIASYDKYPYSQVTGMEAAFGDVAGGGEDAFSQGKAGFEMEGPWIGSQFIPGSNPSMEGNFGVIPFPATGLIPSGSTLGQGNYNIIPRGASNPSAAFQLIAWLAGYGNTQYIAAIDPTGGWVPTGPSVAAAAPYQAYVHKFPWMATFLKQMSNPYSASLRNTPTQSEYYNASQTATENILTKTMTPLKALQYIDKLSNG